MEQNKLNTVCALYILAIDIIFPKNDVWLPITNC